MSNFSILKRLGRGKVEFYSSEQATPYAFPDAVEIQVEPAPPPPPLVDPVEETLTLEAEIENEAAAQAPESAAKTPIDFAKLEADLILQDAHNQAEEILAQARREAEAECQDIRSQAQVDGERSGYAEGLARAMEEGQQYRETMAAEMQEQVAQFLEAASASLDHLMEQSADDLRDLAIAIAEKIVKVSLKSSSDVIARMIQGAIEKHKRQEWVHIYIADCDAKRMAQVPKQLSSALAAMSGRVRIIPMADDESGTCIVEMPEEIIDASVATQIANIRNALAGAPARDDEIDLRFNLLSDQ